MQTVSGTAAKLAACRGHTIHPQRRATQWTQQQNTESPLPHKPWRKFTATSSTRTPITQYNTTQTWGGSATTGGRWNVSKVISTTPVLVAKANRLGLRTQQETCSTLAHDARP